MSWRRAWLATDPWRLFDALLDATGRRLVMKSKEPGEDDKEKKTAKTAGYTFSHATKAAPTPSEQVASV